MRERRAFLPDADLAAEQLVAACLGVDQLKQSLGVSGPLCKDAISRRVRSAAEAMLRGLATRGPAA